MKRILKRFIGSKTITFDKKKLEIIRPLRLHLGCGNDYLDGWVNIDYAKDSKADILMDFRDLKNLFAPNSVKEVMMIHSISYLRLWEAIDFFPIVYELLEKNGKFIFEFPDALKCSRALLESKENIESYLEVIRGLYAFDMNQIKKREKFITYAFGWSGWHMKYELEKIGFSQVTILNPRTHGQRLWRDTRVEAIK